MSQFVCCHTVNVQHQQQTSVSLMCFFNQTSYLCGAVIFVDGRDFHIATLKGMVTFTGNTF